MYNLKVGRAGQGTGRKKKKKAKPDPNKLPYEDDDVPAVEDTAAAGEPAEGGEDRETTEDQGLFSGRVPVPVLDVELIALKCELLLSLFILQITRFRIGVSQFVS